MRKVLTMVALAGVMVTGAACSSSDSDTNPSTTHSTTTVVPTTAGSEDVDGGQSHDPGAVSNSPQHQQPQHQQQHQQQHPANGGAVMPNPNGDGSTVPCEGSICTNPNHGAGTDPHANGGAVMPNPNGDGSTVPCEGSICTNPNHGAGTDAK